MAKSRARWIAAILAAVTVAMSEPAFAGATIKIDETGAAQTVEVITDSAVALESPEPFSELFVANPEIADITSISGTTLYVLGRNPGRTTLMIIRDDSSIISSIDIRVSPDVTELQRRLGEVLPNEQIEVLPANDGLVLTGIASGPEVVSKALEVAGHYAPGKVSNLLTVRVEEAPPAPEPKAVPVEPVVEMVDPAIVEAQIRAILPGEPIKVHVIAKTLVLSGEVSSSKRAQQALQIAQLLADDAAISNLLSVSESKACKVRMRRGNELIETVIPCGSGS